MEKNKSSCSILRSLNLDDIEEVLSEAYHQEGAGRPPRKPIGIFKALIVKRVKQIPSDRELYRRLWHDEDLREVCDIEAEEKPYHPSQLTRFRNRIGVEKLEKIMSTQLDERAPANQQPWNIFPQEIFLRWFKIVWEKGSFEENSFWNDIDAVVSRHVNVSSICSTSQSRRNHLHQG